MNTDIKFNASESISPSFGQRADHISLLQSFDYLTLPEVDAQGRILTLNKTGFMKTQMDPISQDFVSSSRHAKLPVLEIGSAYGVASVAALKNGATVVANDLELEHLILLRKQIDNKYWPKLFLNNQRFPSETNFPDNSLENILCCRVAHFLNPQEIEVALDKIHRWLTSNGRLYFVIVSPYHHRLEWFLETYERRFSEGNPWPGVVGNMEKSWPELIDDVPKEIHVMDERPLIPALEQRGFVIETSRLFDYGVVSNDLARDGREYLGFVARKK